MTQLSSELLTFYDKLRRYAYRVTGSRDDADDIAQEVVLRYLNSGQSYETDKLCNYLYKTARNYMIDRYRRKKPNVSLTTDENNESSLAYSTHFVSMATPDEAVETAEMCSIVRKAIGKLSLQKQEILHLRYDEQMKTKDIAEIVGLSYGNVRRILSETIAQLSKDLEAYK